MNRHDTLTDIERMTNALIAIIRESDDGALSRSETTTVLAAANLLRGVCVGAMTSNEAER